MRKFGLKHRFQMIAFTVIFGSKFSGNGLGIELYRTASFGIMFLLGGFAVFWLGMIVETLEHSQGPDATDEQILPLAGPTPS